MRALIKKTEETNRYLYSKDSDPIVAHYLMMGLSYGPSKGEWYLMEEIEQLDREYGDKARQALQMLIDNNKVMYPFN